MAAPSPWLAVTIDTAAPADPTSFVLQVSSDSGVSNSDSITNIKTPTFDVAGGPYLRVYRSGTLASGLYESGTSCTLITQPDGSNTYSLYTADAAGNQSVGFVSATITIDTLAPSTSTPDLQAASDSGRSSTDNITNTNTPTFTVAAGPYFRLFRDGTQLSGDHETGTTYTTTVQPDGSCTYTVVAIDAAGNVSATSSGLSVTIDTVAPVAPGAPDLQAASDSGISSTDNITNIKTPTFSLTGGGPYYRFYRDGTLLSSSYLSGSSYTLTTQSDGTWNYTLSAVDAAGNESPQSPPLAVTINTTLPAAPPAPDLQAASDTGPSNTDNITGVLNPTFDVAAGPYFRFYRDGYLISGLYEAGTTYTTASQMRGTFAFSVAAVDAVGNISAASESLNVTICTTLDTVYVDANASGPEDGTSWSTAYRSLATALSLAVAGQEIHVADGIYKPTTGTDRTISFVLKNGVWLLGGYAGYGAPDPDARDVAAYPTVLSGDIGVAGSNTDNSYHVMVGSNTDATVVLDGFTISGGNASGPSPDNFGGGMYNSAGLPTVANCTFSSNYASSGGGMYNDHAAPILINCAFTGNSAVDLGGGVYNGSSSPMLISCAFTGNSVSFGTYCGGGGMYNGSSSPTLVSCAFTENSAPGGTYGGGGGMFNQNASSPMLTRCTFTRNTTYYWGGGIYNVLDCSPMLVNCVFYGNSARGGGGMNNDHSTSTLANCTFSDNSASNGGAISNWYSLSTLTNCILWTTTALGGQIYQYTGGATTATYCDIRGGYTGTGNINVDPLFIRNPSPGPDGRWGTADDDYGDLRLQFASPCIDAGNNAAVPAGVTTDLAGQPRFVDLPGVPDTGLGTAPVVDMGAYELAPLAFTMGGSAGSDQYYARLSPDHATLQIWAGLSPAGTPICSYDARAIGSCQFATAGGNDTLTLDLSNGMPPYALSFTAGEGNDTLVLTGMSAAMGLNVQTGQVTAWVCTVACSDVEATILDALAGSVVQVGSLNLGAPLALAAGKGLVLRTSALSIAGSGSLDLADGQMILDYVGSTPAQTVRGWVANAQTGSTPSIRSTALGSTKTLAMIDNALIHMPTFAGQALPSPFSQILIQPALRGDANLDGQVDDHDMLAVFTNMGRLDAQWLLGDLDQDGNVDMDDYAQVQANLGAGLAMTASNLLIAPVKATAPAKSAPAASAKAITKKMVKVSKAKVQKPKATRKAKRS
jgi:hypothetical protein